MMKAGTNGYREGVQVLEMIAEHASSSAKFIATNPAKRFVADYS